LTTGDGSHWNFLRAAHAGEGEFDMSRRIRMLLAFAAVAFTAVPGIAAAGAGTGQHSDDDAAMLADVLRVVHTNFATYNDRKWDEFRLTYAEDAVFLLQNQDPVRGRDAITETHRRVRDAFGPVDLDSIKVVRARANGKIANLVYTFTAQSGHVRALANVFYERQPDGSVVLAVDQPGFREQPLG
jgi:ketosteroid isomerase-like protein